MSLEKKKNPALEAYNYVHNDPWFPERSGMEKPDIDITVLDTFAVPKSVVENETAFRQWFERRFFPLDYGGIANFNELCQEALKIIKEHKYLLSPRLDEDFPISKKIENTVNGEFTNVEDILAFFRKVAVDSSAKKEVLFFSPKRGENKGAERLSVCRILSIAYALDHIKTSNDINEFIDYSRYVFGRKKTPQYESGIFSNLITDRPIDILGKPDEEERILDWMEKSQKIEGCHLNNIGAEGSKRSYYIPEVHIGIKSGLRSFIKVLRSADAEFYPLTDFLRMRFVFDDDVDKEKILELLHDLQEEAKSRKNPKVTINFRAKNYFTDSELKEYFPEIISDNKIEETIQDEDAPAEEKEIRPKEQPTEKKRRQKRKGLYLDEILLDRNISAGQGFRNISATIKLKHPEGGVLFKFELQLLTKSELEANEHLERHSSHFLFEIRQALMAITRLNGKMKKEEIVRSLARYLSKNIKTEQIPERIIGKSKYPEETGSADIDVDIKGSMQEKAEKIFEFLVKDGTLRHVALDFPSKRLPTRKQRMSSGFYIHENVMSRILEALEYQKKAEK
jgi:hypothetical protein